MRRAFRWAAYGLGSIVVIAVFAAAFVWVAGGRIAYRQHELPETSFTTDPSRADVAEGERLARLRGCADDCHGKGVGGADFLDEPFVARVVAPDLSRVFAAYSDAELDRVIRHGLRPDGTSTLIMPSSMFRHLSDADLNDLIAYVRNQPPGNGPQTEFQLGLIARFGFLIGEFRTQVDVIRDEALLDASYRGLDGDLARGRYLALTICSECHGADLRGDAEFAPSLAIAIAYSRDDFDVLMRTGTPIGGRELDLMSDVAQSRLVHLNDVEIDQLHAFLQTLAVSAVAANPAPAIAE